jgi:hypothetical protein
MNSFDKRRVFDCLIHGGETCSVGYHQPGATKKINKKLLRKSYIKCHTLVDLIRQDVPKLRRISYTRRCPIGSSKIALVIDPHDDYHFYRQDPDGYWSHKPGAQPVTRLDAEGVPIIDPMTANRNYKSTHNKELNYTLFCDFFCVPRRVRILLEKGGGRKTFSKTRGLAKKVVATRTFSRKLAR